MSLTDKKLMSEIPSLDADDLNLSELSSSSDSRPSRDSTPEDDEYRSATNSNENLFHNLQYYVLRQNAKLLRKLSLQALSATNDFDTFKRWVYQDLKQHRNQLKEVGENLFFRNENKHDSHNYDIVITFVPICDSQLVIQLQRALQQDHPSFSVEHRKHYFANYVEDALYISASDDFFETYLQIASQEDDNSDPDFCLKSHFPSVECSSLQRQTILNGILKQWRFDLTNSDEGTKENFYQLAKLLVLENNTETGNTIEYLIEAKVVSQIFPLHYDEALSSLKNAWVSKFFSEQPLDQICEYFGIKIAIYFGFIEFYTKSLLYPTLFGLFITYFPFLTLHSNIFYWLQCCSWIFVIEQELLDDVLQFAFTIFNMFWSTVFLQKWELRCRQHVTSWNRLVQPDFSLCHGKKSDKQTEPSNDEGGLRRMIFKYCVTFPALGCSLAITFSVMFYIFHFQVSKQQYFS